MAAYARGRAAAAEDDRRLALWAAWHMAAYGRAKKLDPRGLEKDLRRIGRKRPRRMTPEQMLAKVEQLTALFGGVDLRKKD